VNGPGGRLALAREALRAGNPSAAIAEASAALAQDPQLPQAHMVRARAYLAAGTPVMAFTDLIDALHLPRLGPAMVQRLEAMMVDELLTDLDRNHFMAEALSTAEGTIGHAPRLAAVVTLLGFLRNHDAAAARQFGESLQPGQLSPPALELMARAHLLNDDLNRAIAAHAEAIALAGRKVQDDINFAAMIQHRFHLSRGMRDGLAFPARHKLAICAAIKDEGDDLAEWIAFHAHLGVDRFYLYDNDSSDRTAEILRQLAPRYNITHYRLSRQPAQKLAYLHFFEAHRFEAEWVALIDGDEYLVPEGDSLLPYLDRAPSCAAIAINWRVFGTAGHATRPDDLCISAFTKRGADDHAAHVLIKCIVRPHRVMRWRSPHEQLVLGHYEDGNGERVVPFASRVAPPRYGGLAVHHYALKSRAQAEQKLKRGRPVANTRPDKFRDQSYITWYDANEVEDRSAARFAEAVRGMLE
jgi:hypothetical protein